MDLLPQYFGGRKILQTLLNYSTRYVSHIVNRPRVIYQENLVPRLLLPPPGSVGGGGTVAVGRVDKAETSSWGLREVRNTLCPKFQSIGPYRKEGVEHLFRRWGPSST